MSNMSINLEVTGPLRVFWGWFCLIDRCLSLLHSAVVVQPLSSGISDSKDTKRLWALFFFFTLTSPMSEGFVQSVWRNLWCVGAAIAHKYRGLFMATAGWQTGRECQHAAPPSLQDLAAQRHKVSEARALFNRATMQHRWRKLFSSRSQRAWSQRSDCSG